MATTKIIMPASFQRGMLAAGALLLLGCAATNLTGQYTPAKHENLAIETAMQTPGNNTPLAELMLRQESALRIKPAEPFAWARLSYLRRVVNHDRAGAFEALRFSGRVSPGEPRQLPERVIMWQDYADMDHASQQKDQKTLRR